MLVVSTRATASGSASSLVWSPSTPAATRTRSTWPRRVEASRDHGGDAAPASVTSKVIVSTSSAPRAWSSLAAAARPISSRPTRTTAAQAARHQGAQHGPGDVGGPSDHHRRLGHAHGVVHLAPFTSSSGRRSRGRAFGGLGPGPRAGRPGCRRRRGAGDDTRPRRRDRSETSMPAGSTRSRVARHSAGGGTWPRAARAGAGSPWPGRRGRRRRPRSRRARRGAARAPAAPTGRSRARVHPAMGNDSGPGSPGPNRFSTARNDAMRSCARAG